jgi:hypothetical protein
MASIHEYGFLLEDDRLFIPSTDIDVFPCSRRGQSSIEDGLAGHYDPEARLNTERTNRLHTAINGFKDSFIVNDNFTPGDTLVFVLAGYRVEVKNFNPRAIAETLKATTTLYAHLRLRTDVSLDIEGYFTAILGRQSTSAKNKNYLDVKYEDTVNKLSNDFFTGISFTKDKIESTPDAAIVPYNLPLFSYNKNEWQPVQASLLPKIEHGDTDNSIKFYGDFIVEHGEGEEKQTSFKVEKDLTTLGPTQISKLTVTDTALIEGKTTINNDVSANNITINENGVVKTPLLDAKTITSNFGNVIKVEKGLDVANGHTVYTDTVQADTIKSRVENGNVTIDSPVELSSTLTTAGKTTLQNGLDVTAGATNLEKLSAGATDVTSLVVDTTTQLNGTVNIAGETTVVGKATLQNGLAVTAGDTTLKKLNAEATDVASLAVTGNTTLKNGLNVTAGDTTVKNLTAETTSVNSLTVDTTTQLKGEVNITGATTIVGKATLQNGLDVTAGETSLKNLKAETTIANSLNVTGTGGTTTPSIKVDTITSKSTAADAVITVKKPLKVEGGITITGATAIDNKLTVDNLTVDPAGKLDVKTITNTNSGDTTVTIEKGLTVTDKATLNNGLAVTSGATTLQGLTAGATTLGNLTVNNVTVTGTNNVSTPTLKVDTITSKSTATNAAITIDKPLKATSTLDVSGKATLKNTDISGTLNITGTATANDFSTSNNASIGKKLTTKEAWIADKGQVPAIEIAHLSATDTYQLRFKFGTPITIKEE